MLWINIEREINNNFGIELVVDLTHLMITSSQRQTVKSSWALQTAVALKVKITSQAADQHFMALIALGGPIVAV